MSQEDRDLTALFVSLHDGKIVKFDIDSLARSVSLSCLTNEGLSVSIVLSEVIEAVANNVRPVNLITFVELKDSIDKLSVSGVRALAQSSQPSHMELFRNRMRKLELIKSMNYCSIECHYGCDVVVCFTGSIVVS